MLRMYKNAVLQAIVEAGFDPTAFEPMEASVGGYLPADFGEEEEYLPEVPAFWIRYRGSEPYFVIRNNPSDYHQVDYAYTRFTPTFDRIPATGGYFAPGDFVKFDEALGMFKGWLKGEVAQAVEDDSHPDLWAQLGRDDSVAKNLAAAPLDQEMFSTEERSQIKIALHQFQLSVVKNFEPDEAQLGIIQERLEYLSGAC